MKRALQIAVTLAAWTALALPLCAQEARVYKDGNSWVEVGAGSVAPAKGLKVATEMGSVTLTGGDGPNITWTVKKRVFTSVEKIARRQFADFTFRALQKPEAAFLEGSFAERSGGGRMVIEISVTAPRSTDWVRVETEGGGVKVNNIAGQVNAATAGGGISLHDIAGAAVARTSGGGIEVANVGGGVRLETAGGGISIHSARGRVIAQTAGGSIDVGAVESATLETAGGSINVKQCHGELRAATAGGSVDVGDVSGAVTLETSGGSIRLGSANGMVRATTSGGGIRLNHLTHGAVAKTAAGPIMTEFVAQRGDFSESYLEANVGDVLVYLPPDLPVTVKAIIDVARGHTIHSDFPEVKVSSEGGDFGPQEMYGGGEINGGGPLLKIRTTSGNIELRRGRR